MSYRQVCLAPCSPALVRRAILPVVLVLLALLPVGCGKDTLEAPQPENLTRSWHLTSCEYRHETNAALHVDLVAEGWVIDLYINDNGHFRYTWTPPGGSEQYWDGTWSIAGQIVSLTRDGYGFSWQFTAEVGETSLTLRGANAEYDFDGDGTPEPAIWNLAGRT